MPWPSVCLSHTHSFFSGMDITGICLCIASPATSFQGRNTVTPHLTTVYESHFQFSLQPEIHPLKYTITAIMKVSSKISMFDLKQLRKKIGDINFKTMLVYTQISRFLITIVFSYA